MRAIAVVFSIGVIVLIVLLVGEAGRIDIQSSNASVPADQTQIDEAVSEVNQWFRQRWSDEGVQPAEQTDDMTVFRRLSLALHGTVPSLEEIRNFQSDRGRNRIERWTARMLQDQRFADYFAERLARSLVGTETGPFIIFRRDRLTSWLSEQLKLDTPWTQITQDLIAAEGLWTDRPSANFITVARISDEEGIDENKLAGRTVRTFLGQRIDCAQCHDHPFDEQWKQQHFEGLAAFFCQAHVGFGGVTDRDTVDGKPVEYHIVEPGQEGEEGRVVDPAVPFSSEWLAETGSHRARLAAWVIHPENQRFERAIANRVWGLVFGRPWYDPVDDLPHPDDSSDDPLDLLGRSFRKHDAKLSTLIRIIAASDVFRLSSESSVDSRDEFNAQSREWAVFPLIRLRPEQVIGSLFQAAHIRTVDQNSNPLIRLQRFGTENDFLREYGDQGDDELLQQVGTIPQALLRMNGRFTRDLSEVEAFGGPGQILNYSATDAVVVENCFLACVSRRPSPEELAWFVGQLENATDADESDELDENADENAEDPQPSRKSDVVRDLYWTLFNSPEFSWNH
jgi:Protein of unknown function (DUF1549)/Protein of unknown function (DUF1553)